MVFDDQMVGIWDVKMGEMQYFLSGYIDWVCGVVFLLDSKVLVLVGDDGFLCFWDLSIGDELGSIDVIGFYLMMVVWLFDQKYLLV